MPRKSTPDRLQSLRQKRDQLDAQLKLLEARKKDADRKADTRRKVIAGALALEHFEANRDSEFARTLYRLLEEYVIRPHDRILFPFLPDPQTPPPNSPDADTASDLARAGRETASSS
jgi:hypothetical protein